jgi:hypothetical protein
MLSSLFDRRRVSFGHGRGGIFLLSKLIAWSSRLALSATKTFLNGGPIENDAMPKFDKWNCAILHPVV